MYVQFCSTVFILAVAVANSGNSVKRFSIAAIVKANVSLEVVRASGDQDRPMSAVSTSDRSIILNTFNCQRGLLGASDMNYLVTTFLQKWSISFSNILPRVKSRPKYYSKLRAVHSAVLRFQTTTLITACAIKLIWKLEYSLHSYYCSYISFSLVQVGDI